VTETEGSIQVNGYMEVNMKVKLPPNMTKKALSQEFKTMIERQ
jgi:hypothetical protein